MPIRLIQGDCLEVLRTLEPNSVHCVVTSPPYWRKRDYGVDGQIGLEADPQAFVDAIVAVTSEICRVIVPGGVCWVNMADTYASSGNGGGGSLSKRRRAWRTAVGKTGWRRRPSGWKDKDLVQTSFALAEAIRESGWHLRQTIIWSKSRATEPPRLDRPSSAHEYLFMFSHGKACRARDPGEDWWRSTVWTLSEVNISIGHQAMMPTELARRCISCCTTRGETVLDPFVGSGTSMLVADRLQRNGIGIDLNPEYVDMAASRLSDDSPLFGGVE